jgi:hypothetical protein
MPVSLKRGTVLGEVVMSTTENADRDAAEMTEQSALRLLSSDVPEGYADVGDVRLRYVEA